MSTTASNIGTQGSRENVREKASKVRHDIAAGSRELRETFDTVKDDVKDLAMRAGQAAKEHFDPVEEYIREYPVRSLLMALGAGLVLGMIFRR